MTFDDLAHACALNVRQKASEETALILPFAGGCVILSMALPAGAGRCTTAGGWPHPRKGGEAMPITLTFHVLSWTVTIKVKSRNRHPGR